MRAQWMAAEQAEVETRKILFQNRLAQPQEADTNNVASSLSSSFPTFKNQEPKFQRAKIMFEEIDYSGIAVPWTRMDLSSCSDLYCALCDVWITSKEMMEEHMKGEQHTKEMKAQTVGKEQQKKEKDAE